MNSPKIKSSNFVKTLSGVMMPKFIYGTAWKETYTTDFVFNAIMAGFRGIDTACQPKHYQEDLVGKGIAKAIKELGITRSDIFIQTKFTSLDGQDPKRIPYDKNAELPEQVRQSIEKSLTNLQTEYLDSLVLHSPMNSHNETMTVWKVFEEYVGKGIVKQLGISNIYSLNDLQKIWEESKIKPAVIQNRFYSKSGFDKEIREFCRTNKIYYQSFWTLTASPNILSSREIKNISTARNCTPEQAYFKFVLQLSIIPLTGTTSEKHMKEDLDVLEMEDLTKDEMISIGKYIKDDLNYI